MTIQKLYKQFAEWVTRWEINLRFDEFFEARVGLTLYYLITAIILLGGSSIITYKAIFANLTQEILERGGYNPNISQRIISDTQSILINRFVTIDSLIILFVVIIGFLLTSRTLRPIKSNMIRQKRFIADASHELRTPIAIVVSGLEVALSNKKLDFTLAKKTLEGTLEEMRKFSKLSDTLLDISKYSILARLDHEPIGIDELVKSIAEKYKNLAKLKEISIEVKMESPAVVEGNEIEFSRVFYNILDNAIKYTPQGGTIKASGEIVVPGKYQVTISDNGSGIREEIIDKVFDPFFRGDATRSTNGAGLGLTLVKKIIEDHKGTISIKSELNKGTSMIVSFPTSSF